MRDDVVRTNGGGGGGGEGWGWGAVGLGVGGLKFWESNLFSG